LMIRIWVVIKVLLTGLGLGVALFGWLFFPFRQDVDVVVAATNSRLEVRYAAPQESAASFITISSSSSSSSSSINAASATSTDVSASATPTGITKIIQVDGPLLGPQGVVMSDGGTVNSAGLVGLGGTSCQVMLMEFEFKDSFGKPFVGE